MNFTQNIGPKKNARPNSSLTYRSSHHKQLRLEDNQSLNSLRNDINKTFTGENKLLKSIKDLTSNINPTYTKRIERMCVKFSVCQSPNKQRKFSSNIDVDFIAKRYLKSKSKQKKKEEERLELRRSVRLISRRYMQKQPEEFFKFDHEALKEMERKSRNSMSNNGKKQHPYMTLYEKSQNQALTSLTEGNTLTLGQAAEYPCLFQPDDWQKQRKQIKKIYVGVHNLRNVNAKSRLRNKSSSDMDSFYIT